MRHNVASPCSSPWLDLWTLPPLSETWWKAKLWRTHPNLQLSLEYPGGIGPKESKHKFLMRNKEDQQKLCSTNSPRVPIYSSDYQKNKWARNELTSDKKHTRNCKAEIFVRRRSRTNPCSLAMTATTATTGASSSHKRFKSKSCKSLPRQARTKQTCQKKTHKDKQLNPRAGLTSKTNILLNLWQETLYARRPLTEWKPPAWHTCTGNLPRFHSSATPRLFEPSRAFMHSRPPPSCRMARPMVQRHKIIVRRPVGSGSVYSCNVFPPCRDAKMPMFSESV